MISQKRLTSGFFAAISVLLLTNAAFAQKKYDSGVSDTEIKIGNLMSYSGPASAYGIIGKVEAAYFNMVNDLGGINGRKITFISYDHAYSPPKAVEQARKLIESDEVLLIFSPHGTPPSAAIQKYMNAKKVPELFPASGASRFRDPKDYPWTMGWQPSYLNESRVYAAHLLALKKDAKIAVLYQNDDFGKEMLAGLKEGLGARASQIVAEEPYEVAEPTIDAHIIKAKVAGADAFFSFTTPKFAAQAIKRAAELAWKPIYFQSNVAISVASVIRPAGFDNAEGIISSAYAKDPSDPRWDKDEGMAKYFAFLAKYAPDLDRNDTMGVYGYSMAATMAQILKQSGDELTRDNVMKQAANLKDLDIDTLLPGIQINTGPNDYSPIDQLSIIRFEEGRWQATGDLIDGSKLKVGQ